MVFGLQLSKPQPCSGANLTEQLWIPQLEKADAWEAVSKRTLLWVNTRLTQTEQGEIALTWIVQKTLNQ